MANREHIRILKSGTVAWGLWRDNNPGVTLDLSHGDLSETDLRGADLSGLDLRGASFRNAILRKADLRNSRLVDASFQLTDLTATMFDHSIMGETSFTNVDLSMARGLELVEHKSKSFVTIDTIILSQGKIPESFLRNAGAPLPFIDYARKLVEALTRKQFYPCFISYSRKDLIIVRRLEERLQSRGVKCWRDDHEILPGESISAAIGQGIRQQDRLLLCCSEHSLTSSWVDHEIKAAFEKELEMEQAGSKAHVLIPINLDSYIFDDAWNSVYRAKLLERLAADFTDGDSNWLKFNSEVDKLVRALASNNGESEGTAEAAP
jgi:hypothetical protein